MSEQYIFASSVNDKLLKQTNNLKNENAGFVFDNLFYGDGAVQISRFIPVS